jgi:hypothetical protein
MGRCFVCEYPINDYGLCRCNSNIKSKTPYCQLCEQAIGVDHIVSCVDKSIDWLDLMARLK